MSKTVINRKDFEHKFEDWKKYQLECDPYLKCAVDFLGKNEVSEEAVLASLIRCKEVELSFS